MKTYRNTFIITLILCALVSILYVAGYYLYEKQNAHFRALENAVKALEKMELEFKREIEKVRWKR